MNQMNEARAWAGQSLVQRDLATPAYYFNLQTIIDDIDAVRARLGGEVLQDVSACPLQEMLSRLPLPGRFGAITTCRAELNMVAGWDTDHAYVHLPGLTPQLARAVLGVGHRLIVESPMQIETLAKVRGQRQVEPIILSVHPSALGSGLGDTVGMLRETLDAAVACAKTHGITIAGLSVAHRSAFDADQALALLQGAQDLAREIGQSTGTTLDRLILGEWTDVLQTEQSSDVYRAAVTARHDTVCVQHVGGASIFRRAGIMVTRVTDVQPGPSGPRAVCDAVVRGDFRKNPTLSPARNLSRMGTGQGITTLVGTTARQGDMLGTTPLEIAPNDLIAFDDMGDYFRGFDPVVALEGKRLPAYLFFDLTDDEEASDA